MIDENNNQAGDDQQAEPVATDDTPATPESEPQPETSLDALNKGIESVSEQAEPEPEGDDAPKAEGDAKPEAKPKDESKVDEPPKDEAAEAEIKELGLKERSAERFRELTSKIAELEPLREQAARAQEWEETVQSTGATPQQFGNALGYLQLINSGDPAKMRQAYDFMQQEAGWLGKQLGIEAGGYDPLSEHEDLSEAVSNGDMSRKAALELAGHRAARKQADASRAKQAEADTQKQALDKAKADVAALNSRLQQSDPAFATKLSMLGPALGLIKQAFPPEQWAQQIEVAYMKLPNIAAPAPKPASPSPMRPGSPSAGQMPEPKSSMEALNQALAGMGQ